MAPASDNNNQDLATKKAKLDSNTVINNVGKYFFFFCINKTQKYYNDDENPERIKDTQTQNSDTIKIN